MFHPLKDSSLVYAFKFPLNSFYISLKITAFLNNLRRGEDSKYFSNTLSEKLLACRSVGSKIREMAFIWEYQRPLPKKGYRASSAVKRKSWVHWNIIQECWHTGNSDTITFAIWNWTTPCTLSKSHSFKCEIYLVSLLQVPFPPLCILQYLIITIPRQAHEPMCECARTRTCMHAHTYLYVRTHTLCLL